jgi:zinc protease
MTTALSSHSIETLTLNNGMTLLFKRLAGAPRLAVSWYVPGGNMLDPIPGLSDVVDRLLMKGTQNHSQEAFSSAIDGLTLEVDTDTKRDYSAIYATLLEEDLDTGFALVAEMVYTATLSEFDKEKEKLLGEIAMELDSPQAKASDLLLKNLFPNTAYGVVSSTVLESLPQMNDLQMAKKHYQKVYQPSRMTVVVVGDLSVEKVATALEKHFPKGSAEDASIAKMMQDSKAAIEKLAITESQLVTFPRDDSNQAHIYKGWLLPNSSHPDYYPLVLMNTILGGGGLSSRMFVELRDKQGLGYSVRSSVECYQYSGRMLLYIGTEPKNKQKCLDGFINECDKLIQTPVPAQELEEAKRNILGRRSVYLETAAQWNVYIGSNYMMGRTLKDIELMPERILAVSAADVQRVSQTYFSQPSIVSIVGPSAIL